MGDDVIARRVRVYRQQLGCLHDLAGLAVTALRYLFSDPGLLQRVAAVGRQAFDCLDRLPVDIGHRRLARLDRLAVHMNRARAA